MSFLRQQDIVDHDKLSATSIAIIGSGAIGSFTALALVKMGVKKLTIFDSDTISLHNVSNQYFCLADIGKPKAEATRDECIRQCPELASLDIFARPEMYTSQPLDSQIVIALTDNIEGRAAAFKASQQSFATEFFIDGRMGGELLRLFALNPKSVTLAPKYITDFLEGVANSEEPCTARSIVYNVLLASSMIACYVKKFVTSEFIPFEYVYSFKDFSQVKSKKSGE